MRYRVYPYKMASGGAKQLANKLQGLRVRPDGKYVPHKGDVIVNFGCPLYPNWHTDMKGVLFLNECIAVERASHKFSCLQTLDLKGVPAVPYTVDVKEARQWISDDYTVISRKLLRASQGRGIEVAYPPAEGENYYDAYERLVGGRLFTRYVPHSGEYRVHVFRDNVIDFVKKKKMSPEKMEENRCNFNKMIRNHKNGWVFARQDVELPANVADIAVAAVKACELDFGAVDIIHSKRRGVFVLEINTAPGMEGQTVDHYAAAIKKLVV